MTDRAAEPEITDPRRIRQFAAFFKNYMSISSVVVAILPIPVTSFGVIPVFAPDRDTLGVITSLTCFLTLGFIFYCRHSIARILYVPKLASVGVKARRRAGGGRVARLLLTVLIFMLILLSVALFFAHWAWATDLTQREQNHAELVQELSRAGSSADSTAPASGARAAEAGDAPSGSDAAADPGQPAAGSGAAEGGAPAAAIVVGAGAEDSYSWWRHDPLGQRLLAMLLYTAFFVCAEAAFILMAIKEYLQDLLGLSEFDLIHGQGAAAAPSPPDPASRTDAAPLPPGS